MTNPDGSTRPGPHDGDDRDNPNYPGMPIVAAAGMATFYLVVWWLIHHYHVWSVWK